MHLTAWFCTHKQGSFCLRGFLKPFQEVFRAFWYGWGLCATRFFCTESNAVILWSYFWSSYRLTCSRSMSSAGGNEGEPKSCDLWVLVSGQLAEPLLREISKWNDRDLNNANKGCHVKTTWHINVFHITCPLRTESIGHPLVTGAFPPISVMSNHKELLM